MKVPVTDITHVCITCSDSLIWWCKTVSTLECVSTSYVRLQNMALNLLVPVFFPQKSSNLNLTYHSTMEVNPIIYSRNNAPQINHTPIYLDIHPLIINCYILTDEISIQTTSNQRSRGLFSDQAFPQTHIIQISNKKLDQVIQSQAQPDPID